MARKAGVDFALIFIAILGLWQLARYGAPITRDVQGRLGIDPLLVAAPALSLLAGAVLALRALPLIARTGELFVARGRRLVASLGVWHLGRQPKRYARSALMLILAIAIGVFALSYDATWQTSQRDQAGFATGSDILVSPDMRVGSSIPGYVLADAYARLGGESTSVPVAHATGQLDGLSRPIEYVLVESGAAAGIINYRADQAPAPIGDLLGLTSARRPESGAPQVPGSPEALAITASLAIGPVPPDLPEQPASAYDLAPTVRAVFEDADGIPFRVDLGQIDQSGSPVRLVAPIVHRESSGEAFEPVFPIRLVGVEVREMAPFHPYQRNLEMRIESLEIRDDGRWAEFPLPGSDEMVGSASPIRLAGEEGTVGLTTRDGDLVVIMGSGTTGAESRQPSYFMLWTTPPPEVPVIPVLAASALLEELDLTVGDEMPLAGLTGFNGTGEVVGRIDTFPTVNPELAHPVVVDYPTYLAATFGPGVLPPEPETYWLAVDPDHLATAAGSLRNAPYESAGVVTRAEALTALASDPVSLGTIGSLMMGLIAASVLAGIGFLVNVVVSTRERLGQFALMRAIGLSTRQLLSWVTIENGVTVAFALIFGTLLGVVLSNIVLPLTAVTQQATAVVPELVVIHPWSQIAIIEGVVVLALVAAVLMVARMLSKLQLAALLRAGEE
jgi:hypothetical protein